jgi:cytochrome P450
VPGIVDSLTSVTAAWTGAAIRDLSTDLPLITKRIIMRILFGAEGADEELVQAFLVRKQYLQYRFDCPFFWSEWLPIPLQIRYWGAMRTIDKYLRRRFECERSLRDGSHLLGRMVLSGLEDEEVRDEAITLAITGYETVGDALMWSLWLLAADHDWQASVRQEAQEVFGSGAPAAADAARLRCASMVFSEAMRLYPPTWLFVREAIREERLPSGYRVPAATKIYLCPWVVHRDPRFWADPLRFRPEHFSAEEAAGRPTMAYFPTGAGPRLCLGHNLAMMEGALILSLLVRDFAFSSARAPRVRPVGRMTLRPSGPMPVQVCRLA